MTLMDHTYVAAAYTLVLKRVTILIAYFSVTCSR